MLVGSPAWGWHQRLCCKTLTMRDTRTSPSRLEPLPDALLLIAPLYGHISCALLLMLATHAVCCPAAGPSCCSGSHMASNTGIRLCSMTMRQPCMWTALNWSLWQCSMLC